jgi:hypothetical protein
MTDQATVQEPVVPALVEHVYKYQPRDPENGQPIGGEQVVKYDGSPEDLGAKMADNNSRLIALNRKLNKQVRLSSSTVDQIPESAPRFDESKYELKAEPLTAEERIQLVADIADPEKFDAASKRLVRATIGDPEALRTRLARVEQRLDRSTVQDEAIAFKNGNPDYYACPENLQTLAAWMYKNNLDPIKENFQLAYDSLRDYMTSKPAVAPAVVAAVPEPAPVTPVAPRPVSSGLTRSNGSDSGPAPKTGYSPAEIDKMSSEEYRAKVLVPEFQAKQRAGR